MFTFLYAIGPFILQNFNLVLPALSMKTPSVYHQFRMDYINVFNNQLAIVELKDCFLFMEEGLMTIAPYFLFFD